MSFQNSNEVQGAVVVSENAPFWKRLFQFFGPGLLISVGYMDPGNWATDIEAGSRFGFDLLFVILFSSFAAIILQVLSAKLGVVTQKDLAKQCKENYSNQVSLGLWLLAELAIIATDVAEVIGGALAFRLLFGTSLTTGILITALDTFIVLGLRGKGFRQIESIILGLVLTIGICYAIQLWLVQPDLSQVVRGYVPSFAKISDTEALYLAIGILGATVMPHNLYLHSSLVQTRKVGPKIESVRKAIQFITFDTVVTLAIAFFVNSAILILAGSVFHANGFHAVTSIESAHELIAPIVGTNWASTLFAVALLASGQSSTFTGTIAGQIVMEGFINLKLPVWKRRMITRALALVPALIGVYWFGEHSTGKLLVLSQVVLSLQLPFAVYPLIRFTSDSDLMGEFKISRGMKTLAWFLFGVIVIANSCLLYKLFLKG